MKPILAAFALTIAFAPAANAQPAARAAETCSRDVKAVIAGEDEWSAGACQIKDLATGQSTTVALADAPTAIAERLQTSNIS